MKSLSIIIPMYNVEPYVKRCLLSLENQDIPISDYEILCINDGSPDDCRRVVLQIQKEYDNIILIDQENQGVSRARNNGIDRASGRYLLFIDPDDYVDADSFGRILKNADEKNAQISFLGFTVLNEDKTVSQRIFNETNDLFYSGTEAYSLARGDGRTDPDRMWAVLFKTEFLVNYNLRYLPDVPYLEDGEFISRILCLANRCIFDGYSFYQRTTRQGSATNSGLFYSDKALHGFILAASNLKRFQSEQDLDEIQNFFLNQPVCKFVVLAMTSAAKPFSLKRIGEINRKLKKSGFTALKLDSVDKEYTRLGFLYNNSVHLLIIYQFLINRIRFISLRIKRTLKR
jgi:glycosyltransferase involved in cell wall biosynthesis